MLIEGLSNLLPRPSSHIIEEKLGWVKKRRKSPDKEGREHVGSLNSGRIAKARKGDHGLSPRTIQELQHLCRGKVPYCSPVIWELIRSNTVEEHRKAEPYKSLSDAAFNITHCDTIFAVQRLGGHSARSLTHHDVLRLAALGNLDAITALWLLLNDAIADRAASALLIASYIPPALALLYRRPEGRRIAVLLFARMRQLILDSVSVGNRELSLCRYSVIRAAEAASKRPAFDDDAATMPKRMLEQREVHPDVPNSVADWFKQWCAPTRMSRPSGTSRTKWANPALRPKNLINHGQPDFAYWGQAAQASFQAELKDYW